jgi:DNA-binding NarL/FixJ family response regulator
MPAARCATIVILYRHPLFGEGIARLLAMEPDMEIISVASEDAVAMAQSLSLTPDVVIFERGDPDTAVEVLRAVPEALVIDVDLNPGPTFAYHREEIQTQPDGIVRAIRRVHPFGPAASVSAAVTMAAAIKGLPGA